MKKIYSITLSLVVLFMFAACDSKKDDQSKALAEITIKVGKNEINSVVKSRVIEKVDYEDSKLFQSIMKEQNQSIPYAELGETIQIELGDETPDTYELTEYILKEEGTLKYNKETVKTVDMNMNNRTGSFILTPNWATLLSSNSKDYEPGASIRGFRLVCNWAHQSKEYVYIVRTDAA